MKGISAVIATILMLVITIALAGMAYGYIMGIFRARVEVILTVESADCTASGVWVAVRNGGTKATTTVTVDIAGTTCTITSIAAGGVGTCTVGTASPGVGYHTIRVYSAEGSATGSVYCAV